MARRLKVAVIVNPAAQKGGAARRWSATQSELAARFGPFEPRFTTAPGHATALARAALAEGVRRIVAVGGDGTINEILNGMLDASGRLTAPDAVLCPIPAGTANELCRALGHLAYPARAYEAAASDATRAIDLLRVRCTGLDGRPVERFGYLIVSLGAAATISHRTSRSRWAKKLGGIGPLAMLTTVLPKVYSGGHVHHPKVRVSRGTSFRFEAAVETLVDLDGETLGRLPLEVSVIPRGFWVGQAIGPR